MDISQRVQIYLICCHHVHFMSILQCNKGQIQLPSLLERAEGSVSEICSRVSSVTSNYIFNGFSRSLYKNQVPGDCYLYSRQ